MSRVADLWNLQATDLAIEAQRQRLTELKAQLGETPELVAVRQAAAASQAELARWRAQHQELDTQIRDLSARIQGAERDLMSGRVRNPKELEGMQANVVALQRRRGTLEDGQLEAMLEIDTWQQTAAQDQAKLQDTEHKWGTQQEALTAEIQERVEQLKALATQLKRQWEAISPEDQQLYRDLRSRKGGRALAAVQRNACQACGMILPTGTVQHAHMAGQRVYCPSCGRLLYAER